MLPTTIDAVRSILKSDPSIPVPERGQILALLRGGSNRSKPQPAPANEPRIIRRIEGARRIACSPRTFDKVCKEGLLKKYFLPGRKRAAGVLESDLNALIAGKGV